MQPMWRRKEEALLLQSCSATFFGVRVPGSLTQRPQCNDFLCAPRLAGLCGADRAKLHVRAAVGICTAL
ncbi:unnamed protein product [Prorocentrum cordatum]|uniref:Uncharacterized protein n=1 Tax=Prorocentrum cordatum TaxID=2364126 RepID=A0ABN9PJN8_9DINO|nr:unnamed protein product [Polarella glacialis]